MFVTILYYAKVAKKRARCVTLGGFFLCIDIFDTEISSLIVKTLGLQNSFSVIISVIQSERTNSSHVSALPSQHKAL